MKKISTRAITMTAVLSAIGFILMAIEIPVTFFIPSFVKLDFSELPALIAGFAFGPISGVCVCLVKNIFHLFLSTTGGVGELCNFAIGVFFVVPASLIYKKHKIKKHAVLGALTGAVLMAAASFPINYFVIYPVYSKFMPIEAIVSAYNVIWSNVDSLWEAILYVSTPYTFIFKGLLNTLLTMLIYKHVSPILKGRKA